LHGCDKLHNVKSLYSWRRRNIHEGFDTNSYGKVPRDYSGCLINGVDLRMPKDIIDEIVALKRLVLKQQISKLDTSSTVHLLNMFREELSLTDAWSIDDTDLTVSDNVTVNEVYDLNDIQTSGTFVLDVARVGYSDV